MHPDANSALFTLPAPPRWTTARWGAVRIAVIGASLVAAVAVFVVGDIDGWGRDAAVAVAVGGIVAAGLASAARFAAMPVLPPDSRLSSIGAGRAVAPAVAGQDAAKPVGRRMVGDGGWSLLVVGAACILRAVLVVVGGADPLLLLLPLLAAFIWFTAFMAGWVAGLLVALAASSIGRLVGARRRGAKIAPEWFAVPTVFIALLVFAVAALTAVVLLGAPTGRGSGGLLALMLWQPEGLDAGALAIVWTLRLSALAVVLSIAVLLVGRLRTGGRASQG